MKKIIQISVLFLAILIGMSWAIFRPGIHAFLRLPEPYVASVKEPVQEREAAETEASKGVAPESPQKMVGSETSVPQKTALAETAPPVKEQPDKTKVAKVASEPAMTVGPAPAPAPVPASEDAMKDQQAQIERIVMERYPDIPKIPFPDKYPDLSKLPRAVFPKRIQTRQELNFKLAQEGKLMGVSVVKADGFVRPRRIEGNEIIVASLANNEMTETLPLSETDFAAVIETNYSAGLERAIIRLEEMREAERSEIRKNPTLYQTLIAEKKVWHDPDAEQFDYVKSKAKQKLAGSQFKPVAFFANGDVQVDEDGPYSGVYYVIIVLIEGIDTGFGPYHWRAKCLLRNGQVVGWLGVPEKSADTNF